MSFTGTKYAVFVNGSNSRVATHLPDWEASPRSELNLSRLL